MNDLEIVRKWWDNLTAYGKSEFPNNNPDDEELLAYYDCPADFLYPSENFFD